MALLFSSHPDRPKEAPGSKLSKDIRLNRYLMAGGQQWHRCPFGLWPLETLRSRCFPPFLKQEKKEVLLLQVEVAFPLKCSCSSSHVWILHVSPGLVNPTWEGWSRVQGEAQPASQGPVPCPEGARGRGRPTSLERLSNVGYGGAPRPWRPIFKRSHNHRHTCQV